MSDETYTFTTKDGNFVLTVSKDFLTVCPNPETLENIDLFKNKGVHNYFHNPHGPAFHSVPIDHSEYFIQGKRVNEDQIVPKQTSTEKGEEK